MHPLLVLPAAITSVCTWRSIPPANSDDDDDDDDDDDADDDDTLNSLNFEKLKISY